MWAPLIRPPITLFVGGSESVNNRGVQDITLMWQLVFALCHSLKSNNNNKKNKKGRLMVMANPWNLAMAKTRTQEPPHLFYYRKDMT